jgi:2-aminoadipate transaminase
VSAKALASVAEGHGVEVLAGPRCFADGSGDEYIRLAFSYAGEEQIVEGVARLGRALRSLRST